ncbi:MAG TPA: hypothetical protein VH591_17510 [Ktedonobacterales bacterium]|jgi:hypothetical protein
MSYQKEGVTMRAVWLMPDEPEHLPVDRQAAYGEPEEVDASVLEDRPGVRPPAYAVMDDDDFWEIPTRLAP